MLSDCVVYRIQIVSLKNAISSSGSLMILKLMYHYQVLYQLFYFFVGCSFFSQEICWFSYILWRSMTLLILILTDFSHVYLIGPSHRWLKIYQGFTKDIFHRLFAEWNEVYIYPKRKRKLLWQWNGVNDSNACLKLVRKTLLHRIYVCVSWGKKF